MKEKWLSKEAKNIHQNTVLSSYEESIEILANLKILMKSDKVTIEGMTITTKRRELVKEGLPYVLGALKRKVRMLKIEWKEDDTKSLRNKVKDFISNVFYKVKTVLKPY